VSTGGVGRVAVAATLEADKASDVSGPANVAEFLARVLPWPSGDKDLGFINLHWSKSNPHNDGEKIWLGGATQTISEFTALTKQVLNSMAADIYFCLSQQRRCRTNTVGSRTAVRSKADALMLKAIWLDVDVKEPPKGYETLAEALAAVTEFAKAAGLPKPSAQVESGGGLHVYWISKTPLTPEKWQPYADGLKDAALKHELRCDAGLTSDTARILRVPGTFNHKTNPPRPVRLRDMGNDYDFAADLAQLAVSSTTKKPNATNVFPFPNAKPAAAFTALGAPESLAEGIRYEDRPLAWEPLVKECAFIRAALETGARTTRNRCGT
jgi:hypothetical protein